MAKKFKNLKIREQTKERLQVIARMLNKSQAQVLSEYINELFSLMTIFKPMSQVNIKYDSSVLGEVLRIYLSGASTLVHGTAPNDEIAREQIVDEFERREKDVN